MGQVTTAPAPTRRRNARTVAPRVAHVIPEYLPRSATFVHTLLTHQTRFEPFVFAEETDNLAEFPLDHVDVYGAGNAGPLRHVLDRARARALGHGPYGRELTRRVSSAGCSLLHAHFGWSGRDSVSTAEQLGLPLVTTFYGRDISEPRRARRRNPYRSLFATDALFVVEGPSMAADLSGIGCDAERIRVVPIGIAVDAMAFAPRPRGETLVVVQTGRFVEKKGLDLGLRAFAKARAELGESELWLIGDGPLREELEAIVGELGLETSVRLTGMVSQEEYRTLVARADVCLQPSRTAADGDSEGGAPTVILEAQALGIPVVATTHADIPFVVPRPSELVPENDVDALAGALVALALEGDGERRERLEEARAFVVERHAADVTAAAVEAVYDEALA